MTVEHPGNGTPEQRIAILEAEGRILRAAIDDLRRELRAVAWYDPAFLGLELTEEEQDLIERISRTPRTGEEDFA